jgi:cation transport regulator ChaB
MSNLPALNPLLSWLWDMVSLYNYEEIIVPAGFTEKVKSVKDILKSDTSGMVNSVLDFMINCATTDFLIETNSSELNDIIDYWLASINYDILGRVPIGIKALSKEYYRERWKNSSLIVLRTNWDYKEINGTTFYLPIKMWISDGENLEVIDKDKEVRYIGEEKYYLRIDEKRKKLLPSSPNEKIFVQKPYNSWTDLYANPFIIQRGLWKNLKIYDMINKKSEKIVGKAIEYLMMLKKGTENLTLNGDSNYTYSKEDLDGVKDSLKKVVEDNKTAKGSPTYVTNFDTSLEHIIPEYSKILNQSLYENVEKRLLAGLGLIDIVEGSSSTRRESILNPRPFISEVENGIGDFISLMSDVITTIKLENSKAHPKYLRQSIQLHHLPVKQFVTDNLRDHFRSLYDRGLLSKETYSEVIGDFDIDIEIKKREKEIEDDMEDILYPPIIQNQEGKGYDTKDIKNTETIPTDKKGPEAKNYKGEYEEAPYKTNDDLPQAVKKYPSGAQTVFRNAFNNALQTYKNEATAFKVAWTVLKRWVKKHK